MTTAPTGSAAKNRLPYKLAQISHAAHTNKTPAHHLPRNNRVTDRRSTVDQTNQRADGDQQRLPLDEHAIQWKPLRRSPVAPGSDDRHQEGKDDREHGNATERKRGAHGIV